MIVTEPYGRGAVSRGRAAELLGMPLDDLLRYAGKLGTSSTDFKEDKWETAKRAVWEIPSSLPPSATRGGWLPSPGPAAGESEAIAPALELGALQILLANRRARNLATFRRACRRPPRRPPARQGSGPGTQTPPGDRGTPGDRFPSVPLGDRRPAFFGLRGAHRSRSVARLAPQRRSARPLDHAGGDRRPHPPRSPIAGPPLRRPRSWPNSCPFDQRPLRLASRHRTWERDGPSSPGVRIGAAPG